MKFDFDARSKVRQKTDLERGTGTGSHAGKRGLKKVSPSQSRFN